MSKPDALAIDVADRVLDHLRTMYPDALKAVPSSAQVSLRNITVAAANASIMAAKAEERSIFTDAGRDNDALNSAVGVFRMQQAQPHKSSQTVLWEAIKDYAERAEVNTAHKFSEAQ